MSNIKFINLDPFATGNEEGRIRPYTCELYRDGKCLVDFHNTSTLQELRVHEDNLIIKLLVTHGDTNPSSPYYGQQGKEYSLCFEGVSIKEIELEGLDLDDLGNLEEITLLDEDKGRVQIDIASSIRLIVECSSVELVGL